MKLNSFLLILIFSLFVPVSSYARNANDVLKCVYGKVLSCTETSVTTSGHNRSAQLDKDSCYVLYGTDNTAIGTFEAIECLQGGSSVDVSSTVGIEIGAAEKFFFYTGTNGRYVSCVSANASKHYHLCKMTE